MKSKSNQIPEKKENKKNFIDKDEKILNLKHQEVLAKIENIVGKKLEKNNSFCDKINRSTVYCFDNVSIEDNEEENKSIEIKMEEFESKINSLIGNLVDFHPEETQKKINEKLREQNNNHLAKFILSSGLNKHVNKRKIYMPNFPNLKKVVKSSNSNNKIFFVDNLGNSNNNGNNNSNNNINIKSRNSMMPK